MHGSSNGWPPEISLPGLTDFVIKINHVLLLSDPAQIADIKGALEQLHRIVCGDKRGIRHVVQKVVTTHTRTEQEATCPISPGLPLLQQTYILSTAIQVLISSQNIFGPAAIFGRVISRSDPSKHVGVFSALAGQPPAPARGQWGLDTYTTDVSGYPGLYLNIRTEGTTGDNWDRYHFVLLCQEVATWLEGQGSPSGAMRDFTRALDPAFLQHLTFQWFNAPAARVTARLTRQMMVQVLSTLTWIFNEKGARVLFFNLVNARVIFGGGSIQYSAAPHMLAHPMGGGVENNTHQTNHTRNYQVHES
ncbi:MAG: hypothetical protein Q9195_005256 [Heterodermia aff. obscurata]